MDIGPVSAELHDGAAADVTGDGFKDFVTFTGSTVLVMRGDGAGNFGPPVAYAVGTDPGSLTLGDVDDDGRFDILLAQENAGLAVLLNRCGTQTGSANLSATMTDSHDPVTPGTELTYTITVTTTALTWRPVWLSATRCRRRASSSREWCLAPARSLATTR